MKSFTQKVVQSALNLIHCIVGVRTRIKYRAIITTALIIVCSNIEFSHTEAPNQHRWIVCFDKLSKILQSNFGLSVCGVEIGVLLSSGFLCNSVPIGTIYQD